mgnify:CR=1 FL=1
MLARIDSAITALLNKDTSGRAFVPEVTAPLQVYPGYEDEDRPIAAKSRIVRCISVLENLFPGLVLTSRKITRSEVLVLPDQETLPMVA